MQRSTKSRNLTRKEHIVSRFLLAQFGDAEGKLWVFERGRSPRRSRPEAECTERDFYEYELNGQKTDNAYEKWLSRLEADAVKILPLVLERRRMHPREAAIFASFVACLFIRTRKVRMQLSNAMVGKFRRQAETPTFARDLQYQMFQQGALVQLQDLQGQIQRTLSAMEASPAFYHVIGLRQHTAGLAEAIMGKDWYTIEAPEGKSFLISDCPVVTVELRDGQVLPGAGFKKEKTAVLLPVTSRHCFVAGPANQGWFKVVTPAGVDNLNRVIVEFAHRNVYASANSVDTQLLVDTTINEIVFGENAFLPNPSQN